LGKQFQHSLLYGSKKRSFLHAVPPFILTHLPGYSITLNLKMNNIWPKNFLWLKNKIFKF